MVAGKKTGQASLDMQTINMNTKNKGYIIKSVDNQSDVSSKVH